MVRNHLFFTKKIAKNSLYDFLSIKLQAAPQLHQIHKINITKQILILPNPVIAMIL